MNWYPTDIRWYRHPTRPRWLTWVYRIIFIRFYGILILMEVTG